MGDESSCFVKCRRENILSIVQRLETLLRRFPSQVRTDPVRRLRCTLKRAAERRTEMHLKIEQKPGFNSVMHSACLIARVNK